MSEIDEAESLERTSLGSGTEEECNPFPLAINLTY